MFDYLCRAEVTQGTSQGFGAVESQKPLSKLPLFVLVGIAMGNGVPLKRIAMLMRRKSLCLFFFRIGLISLSHRAQLAFPGHTPDTWKQNIQAHC